MTLIATLHAPLAASAQEGTAEARAAFDEGVRHFGAHRYEEALAAFREAYRIRQHAAVLFNIATSLDRLDRSTEALSAYYRYARERGSSIEPSRRADLDEAVARLAARVTRLHLELPQEGLGVTVDGQRVELGPDPLVLAPGSHTVRLEAPDGRIVAERIHGSAGQTIDLRPELAPREPDVAAPVPEVPAPQPAVTMTAADDGGWPPAWRWIGLGATASLGGALAFTGLTALSLHEDYLKSNEADLRERGLVYRRLSDYVLLPSVVLAGVFTIVAFIVGPRSDESAATRLTPSTSPSGITIAGSF